MNAFKKTPLALLLIATSLSSHAHNYITNKNNITTKEITFSSYNIMAARLNTLDKLSEAINALDADIIGLQEVDVNTMRSAKSAPDKKPVDQAKYLSDKNKMYYKACESIDFDGGKYGTALLSKWPITSTEKIDLVNAEGREQRSACINTITIPGYPAPLTVIVTHPDPERDNSLRLKQVRQIMELIDKVSKNSITVLIGDLNLVPFSPEFKEISYQMNDTMPVEGNYTYPGWNPNRRIDYVLTSKAQEWEIVERKVPSPESQWKGIDWGQISDHLPLIINMRLKEM